MSVRKPWTNKEMIDNKKILVTGGAGFIGSNLVEEFLRLGNIVTCLDNFATGKRENIQPFLANPNFTLIEGDIRDLEICRKAVKGNDHVVHEAALTIFSFPVKMLSLTP